jgi:hypothetical protein
MDNHSLPSRICTRRDRIAAVAGLVFVAMFVASCQPGRAPMESPAETSEPPKLLEGLGSQTHPIDTSSSLAQRYFDQGLILTFGFNHHAAIRAFEEAARLDPACAMCRWGIALALGPNINAPIGPDAAARAYTEIQLALTSKLYPHAMHRSSKRIGRISTTPMRRPCEAFIDQTRATSMQPPYSPRR